MTRGTPTPTSNPAGISGTDYSTAVNTAVGELFKQFGGVLKNVSGSNTITADVQYSTGFSAYVEPLACEFKPVANNTGNTTINLNSLGAKPIKRPDGTQLQSGDLVANQWARLIFVDAADEFVLASFNDIPDISTIETPIKKMWDVDIDLTPTAVETRTVFTLSGVTAEAGDIIELIGDFPYGRALTNAHASQEGLYDFNSYSTLIPQHIFPGDSTDRTAYGIAYAFADALNAPNDTYDVNWMVDGVLSRKILEFNKSFNNNTGVTLSAHKLNEAGMVNGSPFKFEVPDSSEHDYTIECEAQSFDSDNKQGARWYGKVILYKPTGLITQ